MAQPQRIDASLPPNADPLWARVRSEAEAVVRQEPQIAAFIRAAVLDQKSLEDAIVYRISQRPHPAEGPPATTPQAFRHAPRGSPPHRAAFRAGILAAH